MFLWIASIVAGLALLVWGSDRFVLGASATARNRGGSPLVIGLTVVGVGTSMPEILIATVAALDGNTGIAMGNAVGSNIANIGLVMALCALVVPITVHSQTLRREFPLMFVVTALAGLLLWDRSLGRTDGFILLVGFVALLGAMVFTALVAKRSDPLSGEFALEIPAAMPTRTALVWVVVGLAVLLASSRVIVWGAVNIARALEVSDLVIGLTIVAVGTSLPELAASLASVLKREPDLAVGNVLGSNMFNLLPVLGMPGVIAPGAVEPVLLERDFPVMAALSVVLFLMAFGFKGPGRIKRWHGALLFLGFVAYQASIYASSK
jgi:cation:H+ antiporter